MLVSLDGPPLSWWRSRGGSNIYIRTGEGWLFLAALIDMYTRNVMGWSMRETSMPRSLSRRST